MDLIVVQRELDSSTSSSSLSSAWSSTQIASRVMSFGGWLIRLGVGPSERTCAVSMIESEDSRFKLERERKRKRESKYFAKENNSSICIFNEWISLIAAKGYLICCRVFPPPPCSCSWWWKIYMKRLRASLMSTHPNNNNGSTATRLHVIATFFCSSVVLFFSHFETNENAAKSLTGFWPALHLPVRSTPPLVSTSS